MEKYIGESLSIPENQAMEKYIGESLFHHRKSSYGRSILGSPCAVSENQAHVRSISGSLCPSQKTQAMGEVYQGFPVHL